MKRLEVKIKGIYIFLNIGFSLASGKFEFEQLPEMD